MAELALEDGHRMLYHWQAFNEEWLAESLEKRTVYCSKPGDFNDPWDCRPFFNTEVLNDPDENERHIAWAVDVCSRQTRMSGQDIEAMTTTLRHDPAKATNIICRISEAMSAEINQRYRVYCLGPGVGNLLMWAHYADRHKGVCLEFSLRNEVMCSALRCEYLDEFPILKLNEDRDDQALRMLLAKAGAWRYEKDYRLVAQERSHVVGSGTLLTDDGSLKLPQGALVSVIVGCEGDYDRISPLVRAIAPDVRVKRALREPNRYALRIAEQP
ncbi:DUF2971 domain-containing protein [Accumulibacter sp.]|uniref:DUF2971 domain-containing protein n=1 Tax=Accumulibacter sp. TaxID=2053492 RepID=UPI00261AFFDB|nr:DUF2971 domain-containing protein [Accumulibacter sp.]